MLGAPQRPPNRLRRIGQGRGELIIKDGGGSSEARDLWLVAGLVEQLGGTLEQGAAQVRFEFQAEPVSRAARSGSMPSSPRQ